MTVVDSSILISALVENTPEGVWSRNLISGGELYCPELVLAEVANVLRRMEGINQISPAEARLALGDLLNLGLKLHPFAPYATRIWELRHNLTSYDAWYVALAESLDRPLATVDAKLTRASGPRCAFIAPH